MQTNGINYVRHVYCLIKGSKNNSSYQLVKNNFKQSILPDLVKIEPNKDVKTNNLFQKYLKLIPSEDKNQSKKRIGIARTGLSNIYEGCMPNLSKDLNKGGDLIFFEFSNNNETLVIDIFKNFNTQNPFAFKFLLENHEFLIHKKAS